MKIKGKVITGLLIGVFMLGNLTYAANISDADKEVVTVNGHKLTEQNLYDSIILNAGVTPALEVIDLKVLEEKYKDDSRLQDNVDRIYKEIEDASSENDRKITDLFALYGVTKKEDFIKKAGILLEAYRELARIDTAYDDIFTKQEKEYVYKYKISGKAKMYHILIAPEISFEDAMDEKLLNEAKAEAYKKTEEVIKELDEGLSFGDAVKKYSANQLNDTGLIGEYTVESARLAGVPQVITNATFQLEDKQHSTSPIESEYGYVIVYAEYTEPKKPYEEVKNEVAQILYDLYSTNNQFTADYALILFRDNNGLNIEDNILSREYANTRLNTRKSYLHFDPEEANQFGNMGF